MTTAAKIIEILTRRANKIDEQIDRKASVLVSHNTVIRTSEGLYLRREAGVFVPVGIERASHWTEEDAAFIVSKLPSEPSWAPEAVSLRDHLRSERDRLVVMVSEIEAVAA